MNLILRLLFFALTLISAGVTQAANDGPRRDARAIEVLKSMSEYLAGVEQFTVSGTGSTDARLDAGLIVTNPLEVKLKVQRPGSLKISRFDGESTKQIYLHEGSLSLYDTANQFYATADVPDGIEAGMAFALEQYGIDAPLMDLLYQDVFTHLAGTSDPVLYLTGKSRVGGANCHHIVIRSPEVDIQLWVEEGDKPLPRQLILTSKWEGGTPRFVARMQWDLEPEFSNSDFEFTAPEGATRIDFVPTTVE